MCCCCYCCCCCCVASVMSDSLESHRRQPTRLPQPWESPGKNTGVGCHFLLQCMKVKSESEVTQSCPSLHDFMDCSLLGFSIHGISQARVQCATRYYFKSKKFLAWEWARCVWSEFCVLLKSLLKEKIPRLREFSLPFWNGHGWYSIQSENLLSHLLFL